MAFLVEKSYICMKIWTDIVNFDDVTANTGFALK